MASANNEDQAELRQRDGEGRPRWRKKRWIIPGLTLAALSVVFAAAWISRFDIAEDVIAGQLEAYDLPATYKIEQVSGTTQVISDLVIGDPAAPDFTAERVTVSLRYGFGLPQIGSVALEKPRLFARHRANALSFGSLDRVVFSESEDPPALPDINLSLEDARALVETQWGPIGIKAEGRGNLNSGYSGMIAASAPDISFADCRVEDASLYGQLSTQAGAPKFTGPVRFGSILCNAEGFAAADYALEIDAALDRALSGLRINAKINGGRLSLGEYAAAALKGSFAASKPEDVITARYSLRASDIAGPQALAARVMLEGQARADSALQRVEMDGQLAATGMRAGGALIDPLESLAATGEGTFVASLVKRLAAAVRSESRGSALRADVRLRQEGERHSLLIPSGELRGGSGARIASLSRIEMSIADDGVPRFAGNIATGGPGFPKLTGRMESGAGGESVFRLSMEPYAHDGARLAIPALSLRQLPGGGVRFDGQVTASGALPGGIVQDLVVPVSGQWTATGRLALGESCTDIAFGKLELANLRFERRGVTLCPPPGSAMVEYGASGVKIAAGTPSLSLTGTLAETPISLETGAIGIAYPGVMTAREIDIVLGPPDTASRFRVTDLDAQYGDDIAGTFSDGEIQLAAVPLDLRNLSGAWNYAGGALHVTDTSFRLFDREAIPRFEPLAARYATLRLVDNNIDASAELRHPASDRTIALTDIRHDLASGAGYAKIDVPELLFDQALQPAAGSTECVNPTTRSGIESGGLTCRAFGVIANAQGIVQGGGRIDWSADGVTSSSGTFGTDRLDFAAAFGPVSGMSGQIEFVDLVNLTTAPGQVLRIASINPGVEVLNGEVEFRLRDGQIIELGGGSWPFMGGRLILRGVDLNFGISEERRYIFEIIGLQAADFITQMELENLSATGAFDGTVPIVFDENGNGRIETGVLISRPPGGNVSYVGKLTYEDLSPIANFAFEALKSLNYDQMRVIMEGPLTGDIVTRVRFDGVSQGDGAEGNIITRQLAALPLQFRLNIKAQFYQLLTSLKTLYDPAAVRDPRELGLLADDGMRLMPRPSAQDEEGESVGTENIIPNEPVIQDQESEGAL